MFRQVCSNERVKNKILNNKIKKKRKGNLNGEQKGKAAKSPVAAGSSGHTHTQTKKRFSSYRALAMR
jgi:hypothetical protein